MHAAILDTAFASVPSHPVFFTANGKDTNPRAIYLPATIATAAAAPSHQVCSQLKTTKPLAGQPAYSQQFLMSLRTSAPSHQVIFHSHGQRNITKSDHLAPSVSILLPLTLLLHLIDFDLWPFSTPPPAPPPRHPSKLLHVK